MVRAKEIENWHPTGIVGHEGGLIRVDSEGRQQLQTSPASAFKRPGLTKDMLDIGGLSSPPLSETIFDLQEEKSVNLHTFLRISDWQGLMERLEELQQGNMCEIQCSLSEENDELETPIHTAAWKCPVEVTLRMLEITPPDERKALLLRRDECGNTVLHLCCANIDERAEFTIMKNVLLLAPEALDIVNAYGDSPLHLLVSSPGYTKSHDFTVEIAAEEAVTSLLTLVEEQGTLQNNMGLTLLHCAIAHGAHERVVVQLLNIAPDAASVVDSRGMLPLHYCAAFGRIPWTFVQQLIEVYPAALLAPTVDGDTPLHLLVVNAQRQLNEAGLLDRNTSKIAELLLSTPRSQKCALFTPNNEKLYPLHCCAVFDCPPQLTRILMESEHAVEASTLPTHSGWTALHLACVTTTGNKSTENAEALATQRACRTFDKGDRTPIMLALESTSISAVLVKFLAKKCPKSALTPTKKGKNLPLHIALEHNVKDSIIQRLVKANPASLKMKNSAGDTALHIACRRGVPVSTVKFLLSKDKEIRRVKNKKGQYPYDLAESLGVAQDIPELYDPVMVTEKNTCSGSFGSTLSSTESSYKEEFQLSFL
uniref:Uncharacterized protein n=1 Tax=Amphora coffeiformis TaxID=265554 RepID=A0A7S3L4W5_9STRA|mmetsp:Transcript_4547/g.9172  ORF Transcript_4547/g.9172 Transcript_4547/m.9172 type:complete len:595 (+) Transcript_4547:99-1883(+)|eukprot:scaffold7349_cov173-Amphora_coffeaeformis.AAC.63